MRPLSSPSLNLIRHLLNSRDRAQRNKKHVRNMIFRSPSGLLPASFHKVYGYTRVTCAALIGLQICLSFLSYALPLIMFPIWGLLGLAEFAVWPLLVIKAYQHQMFKLPIVGDLAEKQANA